MEMTPEVSDPPRPLVGVGMGQSISDDVLPTSMYPEVGLPVPIVSGRTQFDSKITIGVAFSCSEIFVSSVDLFPTSTHAEVASAVSPIVSFLLNRSSQSA